MERNASAKRASYSPQALANELASGSKPKPAKSGKGSGKPDLARAVKDGVITKAQAAALAKYF